MKSWKTLNTVPASADTRLLQWSHDYEVVENTMPRVTLRL